MKPLIEYSDRGHATIWESGSWQDAQKTGRGCVVSSPEGDPLQVIFDRNPKTANFQFLFFANPGQIIATAFVREMSPGQMKYDLSLMRLRALTTDIVTGKAVLRPEFDTLWTMKQIVPKNMQVHQLIEASYTPERMGYQEVFKELIQAAAEKATTPGEGQRLFWGFPRKKSDS